MARAARTEGRESGTGQDTLKVCVHVPLRFPPRPAWTWRDIVPSCPAVPHRVAKRAPPTVGSPSLAATLYALGVVPPLVAKVIARNAASAM